MGIFDRIKNSFAESGTPEALNELELLNKKKAELEARIRELEARLGKAEPPAGDPALLACKEAGMFDDVTRTALNNIRKNETQELEKTKKETEAAQALREQRAKYCAAFKEALPEFLKAVKQVRPGFEVYVGNPERIKRQDYYCIDVGRGYFFHYPTHFAPSFKNKGDLLLGENGVFRIPGRFFPRDAAFQLSDYQRTFYYPYPESDALELLFAMLMNAYSEDGSYYDHYNSRRFGIGDKDWLELNDAVSENDIQGAVRRFLAITILKTSEALPSSERTLSNSEYAEKNCIGVKVPAGEKKVWTGELEKYLK